MNVAPLTNTDTFILFYDSAVLKNNSMGDGDSVIGSGNTDGAVNRGADSECLADDGIQVWQVIKCCPIFLGGVTRNWVGRGRRSAWVQLGVNVDARGNLVYRILGRNGGGRNYGKGEYFPTETCLSFGILGQEVETP